MEVEGAGLLAEACHMLCQDCWAFRIARFCKLNRTSGIVIWKPLKGPGKFALVGCS